uniref:non-specific serine/threonine protein kinase n=1 Tax=Lepeophtheirus salmonis TaxID=72036 RepID=D3PJE7_LEPSM|nr:Casein kinase I [Lepeophtheirus salmonis]
MSDGLGISEEEFCVNRIWRLNYQIGAGSFGKIFHAVNKRTNEEAAVKMEACRNTSTHLKEEYHLLRKLDNSVGIPRVYWYGKDGEQNLYNALVMEFLGPSLEELLAYCKGKFSVKTVSMLGEQMISRLETIHQFGMVHRDIKPDNFVMGTNKNMHTVYLIDLGLSKYYIDPKTKEHQPFKEFRNLTGTPRFCSINAHCGYEQSRRDDLESLAYVMIYYLRGSLPWQGLPAESKREKYRKIYKTKLGVRPDALCNGLPEEFSKFLSYARSMTFDEEPRYRYLYGLVKQVLQKRRLKYDYNYDWMPEIAEKNE